MNEKGAIYPLVMILCLVLVLFLTNKTHQVISDRQLVSGKEENFRQVRLIQQAAEKAVMQIQENNNDTLKLFSRDGEVEVTIDAVTEHERIIHIQAITKRNNTKQVKVYYNLEQKVVTEWVED